MIRRAAVLALLLSAAAPFARADGVADLRSASSEAKSAERVFDGRTSSGPEPETAEAQAWDPGTSMGIGDVSKPSTHSAWRDPLLLTGGAAAAAGPFMALAGVTPGGWVVAGAGLVLILIGAFL